MVNRLLVVGVVSAAISAVAFDLKPPTAAAYDRYVGVVDARVRAERAGTAPFLWIDRQSASSRAAVMTRLRRGEVVVAPIEERIAGARVDVPDGLIHHWVGTVLLPGVPVDRLVAFVQDYERYPQVFAPMIQRARILNRAPGDVVTYDVLMRTYVQKVISVVMEGDYRIEYHRLTPTRVSTTNVASDLFQIHDAGKPTERREAGDQASGYLWRFRMYCAFDERPEGAIEQCESISLTRGIPFAVSWLVKPFVTGIPRETLEFTLGSVRSALAQRPK